MTKTIIDMPISRRRAAGILGAGALAAAGLPRLARADAEKIMTTVVKIQGVPWFNFLNEGLVEGGQKFNIQTSMVGPVNVDPAQQVRLVEDQIAKKVDVLGLVPLDVKVLAPVLARSSCHFNHILTYHLFTIRRQKLQIMFSLNSIPSIFLSTCCWTSAYFIIGAILPAKKPEYCNRIVVLLHGLAIIVLGMKDCFHKHAPFEDISVKTTDFERFIILISAGYFYFDLGWCIVMNSETRLMIAHHFYSCFVLTRMLYRTSGAPFVCGLTGMELTNPLLQYRWIIRSEGLHDTTLFTTVEISFIILFVFVRVLFGTYIMISVLLNPTADLEFIVMSLMIYVLSWMFTVNIARYFIYRYLTSPTYTEDLRENS